MAVIRKSELRNMSPLEREKKLAELEKVLLELCGEGRRDKAKPVRKAIAKLKTPPHAGAHASRAPQAPAAARAAKAPPSAQPLNTQKPK
jgi:ribosomal protein L29